MAALKAESRQEFGTRATRKLRDGGKVPGIIYGHGKENEAFAVSRHDLKLVLSHGERLVELDLAGSLGHYLIKAVQRDAFDAEVIHLDLTRVNLDEKVEVPVPVTLRGTPAGETDGGVLSQNLMKVTIECLVRSIPDELRVDVKGLGVGDALRVKDLAVPEGSTILADPETLVVSCQVIAEEVEEEAEEGDDSVEPEVIGGKAKEEDEE